MDRTQTKELMAIIKASYPSFYRDGDIKQAIAVWAMMFADDEASLVAAAVKSFIASDTKGFPPVIGQVKSMIYRLKNPETMSEMEAWSIVSKSLKNSAYHAEEEYQRLPEEIQRVITPELLKEWAMANESENTVNSSNFMRSYRMTMSRKEELNKLPEDLREVINRCTVKVLEGTK